MFEDDGDGSKQTSFFKDTSNPADVANLPYFSWENTGVTITDEPVERKASRKGDKRAPRIGPVRENVAMKKATETLTSASPKKRSSTSSAVSSQSSCMDHNELISGQKSQPATRLGSRLHNSAWAQTEWNEFERPSNGQHVACRYSEFQAHPL
jgi:hypothetical protein